MKKITYLLFLLITYTSFGQDVLQNGNFETWTDDTHPDGWTHVENVTKEATVKYEGNFAAKHESTGGTKDLGQTITGIVPGHTYILTIHYKVESGDGTDARIWSKWKSGSTSLDDYKDELQGPNNSYLPTNNNEWGEYTVTMVAPATADSFYFEVRVYAGAVVYWDDFSFIHQAPTTPDIAITSPPDGTIFDPETTSVTISLNISNFNVAQPNNGDGYIIYEFDNEQPVEKYDTNDIVLDNLTPGVHHILVQLVDNTGSALNPPVTAEITFTIKAYIEVATLADLRAGTQGEYYHVTGTSSVLGGTVKNGKITAFVQDATAGIMVYDKNIVFTFDPDTVNNYDEVTDLKGQLSEFNGVLQLIPTTNPVFTGNNVPITPQVITADELNANHEEYESELIKIDNATIDPDGDTTFVLNKNYNLTDATGTTKLRTLIADIEGVTIPTTEVNVTGIAGEYKGTAQIYPRDENDFETVSAAIGKNSIEGLNIYPNPVQNGNLFISSDNSSDKAVYIYSITGKQVFNGEVENGESINISNLKSGVYLIKIIENDKIAVQKLMIK